MAQDRVLVERFFRVGDFGALAMLTDLDASLELASVGGEIPLREIYDSIELPVPPGD